ncbi:tetratricopeptide repeat protein [Roseivirga echinicomitans]
MKKLFFTALLLFFVAGVYGQKKVLKSAEKALKKGEYAEAYTLAKQASADAETKDDPSVYVILGKAKLYQFKADLDNFDLAKESYEHFNTAVAKGDAGLKEDLYFPPVMNSNGDFIGGGEAYIFLQNLLNKRGNDYFGEDDFENAFKYFDLSATIKPDIFMNFYAGYSAYYAEMYEEALPYYAAVAASNEEFENTNFAYNGLIDMYILKKDFDNALKYARAAKERFPDQKVYRDFEIDILIQADKLDEAIDGIQKNIAAGDKTAVLYYALAFLQYNNQDYPAALESANKALELQPDYPDASYVVGIVYFNEGVEILKAANDLKDNAAYDKKREEAYAKFRLALPHFEKAEQSKPDDLFILNPLSTVYDQLGMDAKRDAILARIEALDGE